MFNKVPSNSNCCEIQQLASTYHRMFAILICNIDLRKINDVNSQESLRPRFCSIIWFLLFATAAFVTTITLQLISAASLPTAANNVGIYFPNTSRYIAIAFVLVQSLFTYRKIHVFWCKAYETADFAFRKLGFVISFQHFWKRFITDATIIIVTHIVYFGLRLFFYLRTAIDIKQSCTIILQIFIVYIVLHALFIVNLNSFFIRLLIQYIDLDYRNRTSNLVFDHAEQSHLHRLRLYKQFHYKLWEITTSVSSVFGLSVLILSLHAFFDVVYPIYVICLNVSRRPTAFLISELLIRIHHLSHFISITIYP